MRYSARVMLVPAYLVLLGLLYLAGDWPWVGWPLLMLGLAMFVWPFVRLILSIEFGHRGGDAP